MKSFFRSRSRSRSRSLSLSLSLSLAAVLVLTGGGVAQAMPAPDPPGQGLPCLLSHSVTKLAGSKLKVTFTLKCYQPMAYLYQGITLQNDSKRGVVITKYTCPQPKSCSASATIANPAGTQTFEALDEYIMTKDPPQDRGTYHYLFSVKA